MSWFYNFLSNKSPLSINSQECNDLLTTLDATDTDKFIQFAKTMNMKNKDDREILLSSMYEYIKITKRYIEAVEQTDTESLDYKRSEIYLELLNIICDYYFRENELRFYTAREISRKTGKPIDNDNNLVYAINIYADEIKRIENHMKYKK